MIGKNALNDEPDAIIKSGKLILFFSNKGFFKYLIKLKVFVSHFFSKYCLVIKSVFAFSKTFFIECQTFISISGNLGNLELWIPEEYEFSQYSIDDFIREMLPFAYTNVKQESNLFKMSIKGKLTQNQYNKLLRHIIKEAEFVVLVDN